MALNNNLPYRQSHRLPGFDYRQAGAYFITVCTHHRDPLFGHMVGGQMQLNAAGRMVKSVWDDIPAHFSHVVLDEYVVMPDHFHGILLIPERRGTACRARGDEPSARGDEPSARHDERSARDDEPSARGDERSARGDEPSARGDEPSARGDEPSARDDEPSARDDEPSARDDEPSARGGEVRMAGTACRAPTGMSEFGKPIVGSLATII